MPPWRSADARHNIDELRVGYADVFEALSEIDALGHRVLHRASQSTANLDRLVGVSFLRRSATLFAGARSLIESSSIEVVKLTARAQFELLLAARYLVHGGTRYVELSTLSNARSRDVRSRYFVAAGIRAKIYRRQATADGKWGRLPSAAAQKGLQSEIEEYVSKLERHFPTQHRRYGPLRCFLPEKKRRYYDNIEWYSFGFRKQKVTSIAALSQALGFGPAYDLLYSAYSALVHPKGYEQDLAFEGSSVEVFSPHMAEAFDTMCYYSVSFARLSLLWLCKAYSPESIPDVQATSTRTAHLLRQLGSDLPAGFIE